MKSIINTTFGFLPVILLTINTFGQQSSTDSNIVLEPEQALPLDPKVEIGVLENGLTYYIRENKKPENRAELRLVVNAGSILENEAQLGLAHFVEHMCFNGTENFEKNELISYLQSVGVQFGADLNAYTSFDETVYELPIPTDDEEIVNTAFQILEDWAHRVSFDSEEIEKERGIVLEEWRTGRGAQQRMWDEYFPVLVNNSRYAQRLPIGTRENLEHFEHQALTSFYEHWYRPDLMALIVVGDLDPALVKQKINEHFGTIPKRSTAILRPYYEVPDHEKTFVSIVSDKEASFNTVSVYHKLDVDSLITVENYRHSVITQMYTGMLNQRLRELTQQSNPPFIYGGSGYGRLVRTKDYYALNAYTSDQNILIGLEAILTENERVVQHGFTHGELERFKKDYLNYFEQMFNERDKTESSNYVSEYISHFLEKEASPGIEYELELVREMLPGITLDEVNALSEAFEQDENRVVVITAPEKSDVVLPEKQTVMDMLEMVKGRKLDPYEDAIAGARLLQELPAPGTIIEEKILSDIDITELSLSNGARVVLKPTDFKNDEIIFSAYSEGGQSLYPMEDHYSAENAARIVNACGIGDFSPTDLQKILAGKTVDVNPYISTYAEGMTGNAAPKDLESLFQLVYLSFTEPRQDTALFNSYINRSKSLYKNLMANPSYYFSDQTIKVLTQDHPRGGRFPKEEDWDKVNLDRVFEIYRDRFANAGDFTFYFVGNFKLDSIRDLIEQYLASLPGNAEEEEWKDLGIRPPTGHVEEVFHKGADPKSLVNLYYHGEYEFDREINYTLQSIADYLDIRLIEIIREEKSGVYSIGASANTSNIPYERYRISISFPCSPDNVDSLIAASNKIVDQLSEVEISEDYLKKIKNSQIRDLEIKLKQNAYWLSALQYYYRNGYDPLEIPNYMDRIDRLTSANMLDVAREYLTNENVITLILYPEDKDSLTPTGE